MSESEISTVENPPRDAVPALDQRGENDSHVSAGIAGQQRIDVLKDEPRRPRLLQNSYELKEKAAAASGQTGALAGDAEILARESTGEDVDVWQVARLSDVSVESQSVVSETSGVNSPS